MKDKFEPVYPHDPSSIRLRGEWTIDVYGPNGNLRDSRAGTNVVTTGGKDFIASFLVSAVAASSFFTVKYMAVGTGTTAETASDIALVSEVNRTTCTVTHNGTGIVQYVASFNTNSATGNIAEYGLFSSSTGGVMMARDTESPLSVGSLDTVTVTAQITYS